MFDNIKGITNTIKNNKKIFYAINFLLLLILVSFLLKEPEKQIINEVSSETTSLNNRNFLGDEYSASIEEKLEEILLEIKGVYYVNVMIYVDKTPELVPFYNENTRNESNIEIGSDGFKREIINESTQKDVLQDNNKSKVFEKYYYYPEIKGVLVVADYSGNEQTRKLIINAVKTLLDTNVNNIEVVSAKKKGE